MIFNVEWLKDVLNTNKTANEISTKLNQIGLEVENSVPDEKIFEKIVVAEIIECEDHPDSDHLHVCKVSDGKEVYQIVCGAPNARKGIKVALALVGAYIPNGDFKIKKSKIRGVDSCGMMCSEREMGIGNNHDGIMELPEQCKIGELWVKEYGAMDKMPIELSITPNRGDAISVYGIARDLSACGFGKLEQFKEVHVKESFKTNKTVSVKIDNCMYCCREIRNIDVNVKTPQYILKRHALNGCGDNGIVVNILNYIMFTYGQPMHSYDNDKIGNNIIVDYAKKDTFKTLKGENISFDKSKVLMVSDEKEDLCIAGIMGGDDCKTTSNTKNILLECAYFPTTPITIGGQELKIVSDARFRYERGINPEITEQMLNLATSMIIELCGGEASDIVCDGKKPKEKTIEYPLSLTKRLLGFDIKKERVIEILEGLKMIVADNGDSLSIKVPLFRHDVSIPEDITEELARIDGYDNIPSIPCVSPNISNKTDYDLRLRVKKYLAGENMIECVSMSFVDEKKAELFADIKDELRLKNPIASDLNYMRPSLLVNLVNVISKNESRILENQLSFFEEGAVFNGVCKEQQSLSIAGVFSGYALHTDHFKQPRQYDIFDAKQVLYQLLTTVYGINENNLSVKKCTSDVKYVHPNRSFDVLLKDKIIARFGEVHYAVLKVFDVKDSVVFFELFHSVVKDMVKANKKVFVEQTLQPIVRDISFVVDKTVPASSLIKAYSNNLITDTQVVDVYNIPMIDKKSIAIRYVFQPIEAMDNDQINNLMNKIILAVEEKTGGVVRDGK